MSGNITAINDDDTKKLFNITTDDLAAFHGVLHSSRKHNISSHSGIDQDRPERGNGAAKETTTHTQTHIHMGVDNGFCQSQRGTTIIIPLQGGRRSEKTQKKRKKGYVCEWHSCSSRIWPVQGLFF